MKTVIVDTNVFLRFLLGDIPSQQQTAQQLFHSAKFKRINIIVPQIVIFEILFTLDKYYRFPKAIIAAKLKSLLNAPYLQIKDKQVFLKAIALYENAKVGFVDAFLICLAQTETGRVFSFDRQLLKAAKM